MSFADVKGLSVVEARKKIVELRGQMFEAKMKNVMGQLTSPITIRTMRRQVAQLKTVIGMAEKSTNGEKS